MTGENTQKTLSRLVNYWAECIREEDVQEGDVSPRARTRALIAPFSVDSFVFQDLRIPVDATLQGFVRGATVSGEDVIYGYPVVRYEDADGTRLLPLFTVRLEIAEEEGCHFLQPVEWPLFGVGAAERLGLRSEEVADIAEQVEPLLRAEATLKHRTERTIAALEEVFGHQIQGSLDPVRLLTKSELVNAKAFGVYNACMIARAESTAFNRALLEDLTLLEARRDLSRSALRLLIEEGSSGYNELSAPLLPFRFDEHQLAAMQHVLGNDLTVVTGPPGTGKSEFAANLLVNLLFAGKSVLLVSNTNEAVNVVHERLSDLFPGMMLRTGNKAARQSLRSQLDAAASRTGRSSKEFRGEQVSQHWQRIRQLRDQMRRLHEMNLEFEALDQDLRVSGQILGLSNEALSNAVATSRRAAKLASLLERWRVLDLKARGTGLGVMDRLLARPFPGRLANQTARAERDMFAAMGAAATSLFPESDCSLHSPGVEQSVAEFIRLLGSHEQLAGLTRDLAAYPSRTQIERQTLAAQAAYAERSRAVVGESYLSRLSKSQHGVLRNVIDQLTQRREPMMPSPSQVSSLLDGLPLWTSTLKSLRSTFPLDCAMFDYVVFDEASQVDLPSAAPALYRAERAVVVGDPMQLSHVASTTRQRDQSIAERCGTSDEVDLYPGRVRYCDVSLYSAAERVPNAVPVLLRQHYRSRDSIAMLCNEVFYDGRLEIRTDLRGRRLPRGIAAGVHWHDVQGVSKKHPEGSRLNVQEADVAAKLVRNLVDSARGAPISIGIVTPFSRQERLLQQKVLEVLTPAEVELHQVRVLTAHKFQGREADVIVASLVVSSTGDGGDDRWFNTYPQILNVALSRARDSLHIVADRQYALGHRCRPGCVLSRLAAGASKQRNQQPVPYFDTPYEQSLWAELNNAGLETHGYSLHAQYVADRYTLDLALIGPARLDIECDGSQHQTAGGFPVLSDVARDEFLSLRGWKVLRYPNHRIRFDLPGVVADILSHATAVDVR